MKRPKPITKPPKNWFEAWRQRNGLTKVAAAEALGLHHNTVARYESGELEIPRSVALACAAIAYELKPMGLKD
jgi:transcriptional regulator with XRE-family HTH domain